MSNGCAAPAQVIGTPGIDEEKPSVPGSPGSSHSGNGDEESATADDGRRMSRRKRPRVKIFSKRM